MTWDHDLINRSVVDNPINTNKQKKIRILVSGASRLLVCRLVKRLLVSHPHNQLEYKMYDRSISLSSCFHNDMDNLEFVQADVKTIAELVKALTGVDIAFY